MKTLITLLFLVVLNVSDLYGSFSKENNGWIYTGEDMTKLITVLEKAKSAPAIALKKINSQIEEIKSIPIIDFLNSTYGKVLKDALAKKGLSVAFLNGFKKKLMKSRGERRKAERDEFKIK